MSDAEVCQTEVLKLQVVAALTVIPLISKLVAFCDDRLVLVADIVTCWFALPTEVRDSYERMTSRSGHAVTHLGWDYVDAIEMESNGSPSPDWQRPRQETRPQASEEQVTGQR